MALNEKKIIQIILAKCQEAPERCSGYRDAILDAITDIIQAERQHRAQGTNIQQKVTDKVSAAGRFLASQRGQLTANEE